MHSLKNEEPHRLIQGVSPVMKALKYTSQVQIHKDVLITNLCIHTGITVVSLGQVSYRNDLNERSNM